MMLGGGGPSKLSHPLTDTYIEKMLKKLLTYHYMTLGVFFLSPTQGRSPQPRDEVF